MLPIRWHWFYSHTMLISLMYPALQMHDYGFVRCDCDSSSILASGGDSWLHSMVHSAVDFVTHPIE